MLPGENPMTAPQQEGDMSRDVLNTLDQLHGLAIYQKLQWMEEIFECCEVRNKYKISALPPGGENAVLTDIEFENFPALFEVRENSSVCCRICCMNNRAFQLGLFPPDIPDKPRWPNSPPMLTIDRPFRCARVMNSAQYSGVFRCTICCLCCVVNPQELSVITNRNENLGRVVCDFRFLDCCFKCTAWTKSFNAQGRHIYSFKAPFCGENCCAPTCCNKVFTIHIMDGQDERIQLGKFKNIFPGMNWRGLCSESANNFVIVFPSNATKEDKALILGSLYLHDFMFFEKTQNNNN